PFSMGKCRASARILIIGAGASGISAATRLLQNGFCNVRILEAEDRIGGRVNTVPFADNVVDLGGQWVHGEQRNCVYEMVKDLDLVERTGNFYHNMKMVRSNKQVVPQELGNKLNEIASSCLPKGPNPVVGSMGSHHVEHYWQKVLVQLPDVDRCLAAEVLDSFHKHESSIKGSENLFEISSREHLEYDVCDGDLLIHWRTKGYRRFLRLLMKVDEDDAVGLGILEGNVQLGKKASLIQMIAPGKMFVLCEDGESFYVDHVICTVSLGVLQERLETLFKPPLPETKVKAIRSLSLGTVDKMYLEFKNSPFPEGFGGFYCLWMDNDIRELRKSEYAWVEGITGIHNITCQPRVVLVWVGGCHGRIAETLSDEKVLEGLQWLFQKFLPFKMPAPKCFVRSKWFLNENFRGSYSYRPTRADEHETGPWDLESPILEDDGHPSLMFGGEASSRKYFSTVHGATEAGWREADRLIKYYSTCN
ncbi:hypothetical protein KR009_008752, partial [Drosophila setifemur]